MAMRVDEPLEKKIGMIMLGYRTATESADKIPIKPMSVSVMGLFGVVVVVSSDEEPDSFVTTVIV